MADTVAPIILRCTLCNKPFDKQSTLKRHGYYCRSRNNNSKIVRVRSCVACAKAKTRCDGRSPRCARCVSRNLECLPQVDRTANDSPTNAIGKELQKLQQPLTPESSNLNPADMFLSPDVNFTFHESEPSLVNLDFTNIDYGELDWNMLDTNMDGLQGLENQPLYTDISDTSGPTPIDQYSQSISSFRRIRNSIIPTQGSISSIPSMPSLSVRSFTKKSAITGPSQTIAMLMVHILTSFPQAMKSEESLPPFIHISYLKSSKDLEYKQYESLSTCLSLMQMISTNAPGSRKLLWKNVRLECERLAIEYNNLDKWGLQAAMQALLIYVLLRLQEGETVENNFDFFLLSTLWSVTSALIQTMGAIPSGPHGFLYGPGHKEWLFEESRRRLAVTFTALNMLFSMEPGGLCAVRDGFLLSPLPARKQLWDARDEKQWMIELSRDSGSPSAFGVMLNGQMAKLREEQLSCRGEAVTLEQAAKESSENWQEWCAGMDGLGSLIMLVVSLANSFP